MPEGISAGPHHRQACRGYSVIFRFCAAILPLRPDNVHSADGWRDVLEPVVERYRERDVRRYFRGDAAFALPDLYEFLEAKGFLYAIRVPKNQVLQESIAHLLTRPVGRPPNHVRRCYASFSYQAGTWNKKRRVVAKACAARERSSVASWGTGSPRRFHRHQPEPSG